MKAYTLLPLLAAAAVAAPASSKTQADRLIKQTSNELEALSVDSWQSVQLAMAGFTAKAEDTKSELEAMSVDAWQEVQGALSGWKDAAQDKAEKWSGESWKLVEDLAEEVDRQAESMLEEAEAKAKEQEELAMAWPGHEKPLDLSKYTIGQILNWTLKHAHDDRYHTLPLHKFAFLANLSHPVIELLSDPEGDFTLFAPDDKALTPPSRRGKGRGHGHGHEHHADLEAEVEEQDDVATINEAHPFWEAAHALRAEACPHHQAAMKAKHNEDDNEDDDKREKRKRFILGIITAVLKYHVSPGAKTLSEILDSSTLATALPIGRGDDASTFRIRVGEPALLPPGKVALNFISTLGRPVIAKNGVIYLLGDAPLLPPLSPLSQLFLFPEPFSTLTSAVQKVGLDEALLPHYGNKTLPLSVEEDSDEDEVDARVYAALGEIVEEKSKFSKNSYTVFAPTNRAFKSLGFKLNAFLFSPFGSHILKYVLSYHVVPDVIFHTDHIVNATASTLITSSENDVAWPEELDWFESEGIEMPHVPGFPKPPKAPEGPTPPGQVNVTHYLLPTLLGSRANESLAVDVVQYRLRLGHGPLVRRVVVKPSSDGHSHGHGPPSKPIPALIADGVAWGGAVHVLPKLIKPPVPEHFKHHGHQKQMLKALWQ